MSKYCKVCRAPSSELDGQGRCRSCAVILAASNAGMSYGKYMALNGYHEPFTPVLVDVEEEEETVKKCQWCGAAIAPGSGGRKFCSFDCYYANVLQKEREHRRNKSCGKVVNDG